MLKGNHFPRQGRSAGSRWLSAAMAAAASLACATAYAGPVASGGFLAGTEAQRGFFGVEAPITGDIDSGFIQRLLLDWQVYPAALGATSAQVSSPGAAYALGYRSGGPAGWWGGYLGVQYRQADVAPEQPDDEVAGDDWQVGFHFDGALALTADWSVSGRLETYPQSKGVAVRGRLLRELGNGYSFGPELLVEADEDHAAQQLGVVLTAPERVPGLRVSATIGAQRDDEGDVGGYLGIEFSRDF